MLAQIAINITHVMIFFILHCDDVSMDFNMIKKAIKKESFNTKELKICDKKYLLWFKKLYEYHLTCFVLYPFAKAQE